MKNIFIMGVLIFSIILTGCTSSEKADLSIASASQPDETEIIKCKNLDDIQNEYGCNPRMACDSGTICRKGECVEEINAIDEYECNPDMTCEENKVCRDNICVDATEAPDEYSCHPGTQCDNDEICREDLCIKICK